MGLLFDNPIANTAGWIVIAGGVGFGVVKLFDIEVPIINEINISEDTAQTNSQQNNLPATDTTVTEPIVEQDPRIIIARDDFAFYNLALSPKIKESLADQNIESKFVTIPDQKERLDFTNSDHNFALTTVDNVLKYLEDGVVISLFDTTVGGDCVFTSPAIGGSFAAAKSIGDLRVAYPPNTPSDFLWEITRTLANINDGTENNLDVLDSAEALKALKKSQVDIAVLWQPECSQAYEKGFYTLITTQNFRGYINDVFAGKKEFVDKHSDIVQTYLRSYYANIFDLQKNNRMTDLTQIIGQHYTTSGVKVFNPITANDWIVGGNFDKAVEQIKKIQSSTKTVETDFSFMNRAIGPYVKSYQGELNNIQKAQLRNLRKSPPAQPMRVDYSKYRKIKTVTVGDLAQLSTELNTYDFGSYLFKVVISHDNPSILESRSNYIVTTLQDYGVINQIDFQTKSGPTSSIVEIWQDVGN